MMINFISHRVNKLDDLLQLPTEYGVEIDLRDSLDGKIYLEHDPFIPGEDFKEYCRNYRHGTMILNIKSERVEVKAIEILKKYNITDYFFLDSSFPMIIQLSGSGEYNTALRFSEFEGLDTIHNMAGRAKWVWVDCFTKMPLTGSIYSELHSLGYKICIVSPELQKQPEKLSVYADYLKDNNIIPDAICTKTHNIGIWKELLEN